MKSYIQGLITGAVFVFALMVLMGASKEKPVGKYQFQIAKGFWSVLDTQTGAVYEAERKGLKLLWKEKPSIPGFKQLAIVRPPV